jgi:hypothetical protein
MVPFLVSVRAATSTPAAATAKITPCERRPFSASRPQLGQRGAMEVHALVKKLVWLDGLHGWGTSLLYRLPRSKPWQVVP